MTQGQVYDVVFEGGGGAKGLAFVGALQVMEAQGARFRRLVGTSAGAITATLLAAGYDAAGALEVSRERADDGRPRFATFLDIPGTFELSEVRNSFTFDLFRRVNIPGLPERWEERVDTAVFQQLQHFAGYRQVFSFVERGGLYEGTRFLEWLQEKLDASGRGFADSTLASFHKRTGQDLTVVASDTTSGTMLVLNHRTAPECPVRWAVRMSMSIPFLWQEVRWREDWGPYRGESIADHAIVDGGILSNFPLDLVTSSSAGVRALMGDPAPGQAEPLGLLIDETLEVPGSGEPQDSPGVRDRVEEGLRDNPHRLRIVERVRRIVDTITDAHDKGVIEAFAGKVCRLPARGYGTTEFDMTEARMEALI